MSIKKTLLVSALVLTLLCVSCVSLTEGGKTVNYVTKQEAPAECELVSEVDTGYSPAGSVADVKVLLRNATAEAGGNFLVIDTFEKGYNSSGGQYYLGNGRAYECPEG